MSSSSSPDIVSILENSKELDRLRKDQEDILSEINKLHKKLQTTPEVVEKPGDNSLAKLKMLYTQAKELSDTEANLSTMLISQLDALFPPGPQGQPRRRLGNEQKRKRVKTESDISRLTPSMRNQLEACASLKGEQVAARVTPRNADKDEWFVVKVIHFDKELKEFEVLDEEPGDDEDSSGQSFPWEISFLSPRVMILQVPKISLLENMFWQFIQELLHSIKQQLFMAIAGGRQMIMCWSLMMTKKTGRYLKGLCPSTKWFLYQKDIVSKVHK
ncbi:unnamed protein product [Trifolium pratense]|uniref:Uncharacterized protein n=1 Tax=Trifolium pratense TaxID=57577 RepID=A0ACB0LJI5_TRIPR|nr:unnamed protein product [Trifolium pratense]